MRIALLMTIILSTFLFAKDVKKEELKSYIDSIQVTEIEPKKLYNMIEEDKEKFYVIDIREPGQIMHGEIFHFDSMTITRGYLEFKVEKAIPDKKTKIIVYCCTGQRGKLAAKTLGDMGYKNVSSLKGGVRGWVEAGLPLDTVYGEMILH